MSSVAGELLSFDRERLDLRAGVIGLCVLSVFGAAVVVVGPVALAAAIGALAVLATDPPPRGGSWAAALLPIVAGGAGLTFLAVLIGDRAVAAAVLVGLVGVAATVRSGRSRKAGVRTLVTTLWVIIALTLGGTGSTAPDYAAAFAVGGAVGTAVALLRARDGDEEGTGSDDVESPDESSDPSPPEQIRDVLPFAVLRGVGLGLAVLLGFLWFPDHPVWMAITALIVMRPPTREAFVVGLQRSLGTGVGVLVAVAVAGVVGDNRPGLVLLFLGSAFVMMAVREVNYALFAMVVAALVVYSQRILGADAAESGRDRVAETLLGVLIAFVVLGLAEALARRRKVPR